MRNPKRYEDSKRYDLEMIFLMSLISRILADPVHSGGGDCPVLRECSVVINSLEEIPDSGDDSSPAKSTNEGRRAVNGYPFCTLSPELTPH